MNKWILSLTFCVTLVSGEALDTYLTRFDYSERDAMKIKGAEAMDLITSGKAQLIDIRFPEETAMYTFSFAKTIPINELPKRLNELDRNKTIITMCPHYDRALMARLYLTLEGFHARYLTDGAIGLATLLRGDIAKETYDDLHKVTP